MFCLTQLFIWYKFFFAATLSNELMNGPINVSQRGTTSRRISK